MGHNIFFHWLNLEGHKYRLKRKENEQKSCGDILAR